MGWYAWAVGPEEMDEIFAQTLTGDCKDGCHY
jgi:hypothetical protein